ncbi:MAG: ureidoglycolate lyase [Roseobacter sp.]|nr:ureidoglycolate lyase [Roseobacter sp.]
MTRTINVPLEPLDETRFSAFGWLLSAGSGPADFERPGLWNWRLPFQSDAQLRLQVMRYGYQPMRLSCLEQHLCVTEARMPIGDAPAVLIVAQTTDKQCKPKADTLRAFLMDGRTGIMFRPGVWHGLDCFALAPPHVDYLFLSDSATEDEIEALGGPTNGIRTRVYDFLVEEDTEFSVTDPDALLLQGQI